MLLCYVMFTVRLVRHRYAHERPEEGRLEVHYNGVWKAVCEDGFNDAATTVVCRSLGFPYV